MKISSIINKYMNKISLYGKNKFKYKNIYYFQNTQKVNKILFYFPNYELMHLGDHFFFEPAIRELKKIGFDVYVKPIKLMEFYFLKNNHKLYSENNEFRDIDLIISKVEFFYDLKKFINKKNIILFNTSDNNINQPICSDIIKKVFHHLNINFNSINDKPSLLNSFSSKIDLNGNEKYILFNNYIDSSAFRINKKMLKSLDDKAKEIKKRFNVRIIHTGSQNDKKNDYKSYDFVDLDLRGKTTVEDIFYLLSRDNVLYNVSFDAFQMHVAFLYNKKSFIKFRGRFLKNNKDFIINYVNPPFTVKDKKNLIEYI